MHPSSFDEDDLYHQQQQASNLNLNSSISSSNLSPNRDTSSPDSVIITSTTSSESTSSHLLIVESSNLVSSISSNVQSSNSSTKMIKTEEQEEDLDDAFVVSSSSGGGIEDNDYESATATSSSSSAFCDADSSTFLYSSSPSDQNLIELSQSNNATTTETTSAQASSASILTASEAKNVTMHRYYQKSSSISTSTRPPLDSSNSLFGNSWNPNSSSFNASNFSAPPPPSPPTFNDLICRSFINPELNDSILDSLDSSGSDLDSDDSGSFGSSGSKMVMISSGSVGDKGKQRLPLEDFMRKIVFQINSTSDKVWSNLLLDFTKSFAEYQVPYNGFATNDYDLLLDILNIAMKSLESPQCDRRVFASRLLLNINELLNPELIRTKVMPVLKRVLTEVISSDDSNKPQQSNSSEQNTSESTIVLRFNLCYVLAHFAQRLGFCYFVSHIFPFYEQMARQKYNNSTSHSNNYSSIAIDFALLDSHIFLLSTVLHYNEVLSNKCSPVPTPTHDLGHDQNHDTEMTPSPLSSVEHDNFLSSDASNSSTATDSTTSTATSSASDLLHRHMSSKEVFDFISDRFIPLLKQLFGSLLDAVVHYRTACIPLDQDSLDCFVQWKDQNRSTNESIIQTVYSHYQNFIFFALLLRDYLKKSCYNDLDDEQTEEQESEIAQMVEMMETKFTLMDAWYREYYGRLVQFLFAPMVQERSIIPQQLNFSQFTLSLSPNNIGNNIETQELIAPPLSVQEELECVQDVEDEELCKDGSLDDSFIADDDDDDEEHPNQIKNPECESNSITTLVNDCMLTKITICTETASSTTISNDMSINSDKPSTSSSCIEFSSESQPSSSTSTPTTSSFIGKFQLTESKIMFQNQQQQQQQSILSQMTTPSTSNAAFFNMARLSSMRDMHHHQQQTHFPSSEIFGFFEFKTITCKAALINSVPILFDLYYVTQSTSEIAANSVANKLNSSISSNNRRNSTSEALTFSSISTRCDDPLVIGHFVESLIAIVSDHSPEIVNKMINVFHKLISRLPNSIRFYSFLVSLLQSQNVQVLANVASKFTDIFGTMIRQQQQPSLTRDSLNQDQSILQANSVQCDSAYIQTAVEFILNAFLRSEAFLSTKPNWRLYIQYLEVMLDFSRMIPSSITKKLIVPRLLLRFSTTRHIPSRQAVTRCLLIIYLEQFAQYEHIGSDSSLTSCAKLDFDIFEWFDSNLRTASKYQQRQIYVDIYALLLRLTFLNATTSSENSTVRDYFQRLRSDSSAEQNLYIVDLIPFVPKMYTVEFERFALPLVPESERVRLVAMIVGRYDLLEKLTILSLEDKVPTIRASSATVLHSLIHVLKCGAISSHLDHPDCTAARLLTSYLTVELMERLFERVHQDRDRLVVGQLKRLFKLVDSARNDLNLSQPSKISEEPNLSSELSSDEFITPIDKQTASPSPPELEEVLDEVYLLMNDLLSLVQSNEQKSELEELSVTVNGKKRENEEEEIDMFVDEDEEEGDVAMVELSSLAMVEDQVDNIMMQSDDPSTSNLETCLTTLTISTTTITVTDSSESTSPSPSSSSPQTNTVVSPRRGIIVISSSTNAEMIKSANESSSAKSPSSRKKSKKSPPTSSNAGKLKLGGHSPPGKGSTKGSIALTGSTTSSSKLSMNNKRNLHSSSSSSSMIPLSLSPRALSPQPPYAFNSLANTPNNLRTQPNRYTLTPHVNFANKSKSNLITSSNGPNLIRSASSSAVLNQSSSSSNTAGTLKNAANKSQQKQSGSNRSSLNNNSSYELKPMPNPNYYNHQIPVRGTANSTAAAAQPSKAALLPTPPTPPLLSTPNNTTNQSKLPIMFKQQQQSGNLGHIPVSGPPFTQYGNQASPSIVVTNTPTSGDHGPILVHSNGPHAPHYFVASHIAHPHFAPPPPPSSHYAHSIAQHHQNHVQQQQQQQSSHGQQPSIVPNNHFNPKNPNQKQNRSNTLMKSSSSINNVQQQQTRQNQTANCNNNNNGTNANRTARNNSLTNNNNNGNNGPTTSHRSNQKSIRKQSSSTTTTTNIQPIKILSNPRSASSALKENNESVDNNEVDLLLLSPNGHDDNANCCHIDGDASPPQ